MKLGSNSPMRIDTNQDEDIITVDDIVKAIQRGPMSDRFRAVNATSPDENKTHTVGSRWSMMKSVIGIAKPRASIYTGYTQHNDYQRILDQWIRLCGAQGTPLSQTTKIAEEFKKRMNREGTYGAKEKLSFNRCDLTDPQVIALSRVLAENPKIAVLDFTDNDNVNEPGVVAMNNLVLCQLEASKLLANDDSLVRVSFLNEIKWSKKQFQYVPIDVLQALEDLRITNAKILIKSTYQSIGSPAPINDEVNRTMWKKIIQREPSHRLSGRQTLPYNALESQLIQGMIDNHLLPRRGSLPSSRGSIFSSRGSFFAGTPTDSPSQRLSGTFFPTNGSNASTPAKQAQGTSVRSLFGDVDGDQNEAGDDVAVERKLSLHSLQTPRIASSDEKDGADFKSRSKDSSTGTKETSTSQSQVESEPFLVPEDANQKKSELIAENTTNVVSDTIEDALIEEQVREESVVLLPREDSASAEKQHQENGDSHSERRPSFAESIDLTVSDDTHVQFGALSIDQDFVSELAESEYNRSDSPDREIARDPVIINIADIAREEGIASIYTKDLGDVEYISQHEDEEDVVNMSGRDEEVLETAEEVEPIDENELSQMIDEDHDAVVMDSSADPLVLEEESTPLFTVESVETEDYVPSALTDRQYSEDHQELKLLLNKPASQSLDFEDRPSILQRGLASVGSTDGEEYHRLHAASSHDSRYENFDLQELHVLHDLYTPEVVDTIQEIIEALEMQEVHEAADEEFKEMLQQQALIGLNHSESTDMKDMEQKISSSYDTTEPTDSDVKNSQDTSEFSKMTQEEGEDDHHSHSEHQHELPVSYSRDRNDDEEEEEVAPYDPEHDDEEQEEDDGEFAALQSPGDRWQINLHSDSEWHATDADNEDDAHYDDDVDFGYDAIHGPTSEYDDALPPITEIIVQSRTTADISRFSAENPLRADSVDEESLTDNLENPNYDSLSSAGFDMMDSSVEYSDAEAFLEDQHYQEELQTAQQVKDTSDFPRIVDLINAQRTDTNMNFTTYLTPEQYEQVRVLLMKENFFTDIQSLQLREFFPRLRELDLAKNYLYGEITTKILPSKLRKLDLSRNQLTNIKGLIYCRKLEELHLAYNRIRFLDPLPPTLMMLDISCNWIDSVTTFRALARNHRLQELDISGNVVANMKSVEGNIKKLVPGLLKCSIVYDRMLVKRRTSPRIKGSANNTSRHSSPQHSPKNSNQRYNELINTSSPDTKHRHPSRPLTQHQQNLLLHNSLQINHSPAVAVPAAPTATTSPSNPRLEAAAKALRDKSDDKQLKQEKLRKAKEFGEKVREQAMGKKSQENSRSTTPSGSHHTAAANTMKHPLFHHHFPNRFNSDANKAALQSQPSFMSEVTMGSSSIAYTSTPPGGSVTSEVGGGNKLRKTGLMAESFLSRATEVNPASTVTNQTNSSKPPVVRRPSNSSANGHNGTSPKHRGKKLVKHWIHKTQNRLTRSQAVFLKIIELAKTEKLLSDTTHYSLLQEWAKIGFFDLDPGVCAFIPFKKPEFLVIPNITEEDDDYEGVTPEEIALAARFYDEIVDYHEIFVKIYIALEISILHQILFRALLQPILETAMGKRIIDRLHLTIDLHEDVENKQRNENQSSIHMDVNIDKATMSTDEMKNVDELYATY